MYSLPQLSYEFSALEPHIDTKTMEIHYTKHHQTYIDKANAALANLPQFSEQPVETLLQNIQTVPESLRQTLINNAGGHSNHALFWSVMTPGGKQISPAFKAKIDEVFGSLEAFLQQFHEAGLNRFGSGWVWLVTDNKDSLKVISTPNQDSPYLQNLTPILGLDVWEHAYYLNYQNKRADYITAWWNVVNWEQVEINYQQVKN